MLVEDHYGVGDTINAGVATGTVEAMTRAQELSSKEVTMRLVAKTAPMRQWEVARELRARVKAALDAAGVQPAGPDTIVVSAPPAITPAPPGLPEPVAVVEAEVADEGEGPGPDSP